MYTEKCPLLCKQSYYAQEMRFTSVISNSTSDINAIWKPIPMSFIKGRVENGYDKINDVSTHGILIKLKRYDIATKVHVPY